MTAQEQINFASISYSNYLYIKRTYYPKEKVMTAQQYKRLFQ